MSLNLPPVSEPVAAVMDQFRRERIIGILRTGDAEGCLWAADILIEAGFRLLEIPFTVPETARIIETLSEKYPDVAVGAGTVLTGPEAVTALGAGAKFLVSPVLNEGLVQFGREHQVAVLPGCMTPTEIYRATMLGAPAVKYFPAQASGGPEFMKALQGPFPHIPLVPTGGIERNHIPDYLKAGALAIGVGGPVVPARAILNRDVNGLKELAKFYWEAAKPFRGA